MTLPNNNRQPGIIQVRIPELPPADALTGLELVWITQEGRSRKTFIQDIASFVDGNWILASAAMAASAGQRIATDTSSGSWTLSLPNAPSAGQTVQVADAAGTWGTQPLVVNPNGNTLEGLAQSMTMELTRAHVTFLFDGSTWKVFG